MLQAAAIATIMAITTGVNAKGSSHPKPGAYASPRAACMWQSPGYLKMFNLYAVQTISVSPDGLLTLDFGYGADHEVTDGAKNYERIKQRLNECQESD